MSQYLLSVHYVDGVGATPEAEQQEAFEATGRFNDEIQAEGVWVFAGGLHTPDMATVVDATGADTITTDGPFSEAKEQIGGFYLIDVPDLATAIELARLLPPEYTIEVRPTLGITV